MSELKRFLSTLAFVTANERYSSWSESMSSGVLCVSRTVSPESEADMTRLLTVAAASLNPPKGV